MHQLSIALLKFFRKSGLVAISRGHKAVSCAFLLSSKVVLLKPDQNLQHSEICSPHLPTSVGCYTCVQLGVPFAKEQLLT